MRRLCGLVVVVAACATSRPIPPPDTIELPQLRFKMQDFQLPSGLRILAQEDHGSPTVAVVTVVGAGGSDDPRGKEGVAHLLEHLTFRARPGGGAAVWDRLEAGGAGDFNAETRADATIYTNAGAIEALPAILRIETERMLDPLAGVDAQVLATEREVVRNELRENIETGFSGSIVTWLHAALFPPQHPYSRPPFGTHDSLSAITLDDLRKFVKLHYRPDNMTMMIVGDFNLDAFREVLQKSIANPIIGDGDHPLKPPSERIAFHAPPPPSSPAHAPYHYEGPVDAPEIWIGWTIPGAYRPDSEVMDTLIEGLADFWLPDAIQEDRDIESIDVGTLPGIEASILYVRAQLRTGSHAEESGQRILDEVWKLSILPESTMGRLNRVIADQLALGAEAPLRRAEHTAVFTHFSGSPHYYARNFDAIVRMKADSVTSFAKQYLDKSRARMLVIQPSGTRAFKPAGGSGVSRAGLQPPASSDEPVHHEPADVIKIAHPPGFDSFRVGKLPSGLEYVIAQRGTLPLVSVGLGFHGGTAGGTKPGVVELAEGAGIPEKEHNESEWGASASSDESGDLVVHTMRGFATAIDPLLGLLVERIQSMRARYTIIENFKKYRLDVLRHREKNADIRARRSFWTALYGDHPYARFTRADDFEKLGQGDANDWIARSYHPGNAVLAVVGSLQPASVKQLVGEWFGEWSGEKDGGFVRPPPLPSLAAHPPKILVTGRRGATQGEVLLGCLLPAATDAQEPVYDLLAEVLKRHLFRSLRQDLGATYGVDAMAFERRGGAAHLLLTTTIENGALAAGLHAIREELAAFDSGKLDENEVNAARWDVARRFNLRFTTNTAVLSEILDRRSHGWRVDGIDQYPERLAAVSVGDLRVAFQTCSNTEVLSVAGDESIVRAALREGWEK